MDSIGWPVVLFEVSGLDAERYLNNRLTNAIKTLAIGQTEWAAALSPQGRTQGFFLVQRTAADSFSLLAEGGDPESLKEGLLRFKVSDRITVSVVPAMRAIWSEKEQFTASETCLFFNQSFGKRKGHLVVGSAEALSLRDTDGVVSIREEYGCISAEELFPRFPSELSEKFLFSEAGLENAVSYTKGCFVGQEVVHKLSAFASLPSELAVAAFPLEANVRVGNTYQGDTEEILGSIISIYRNAVKTLCFIRIKSERPTDLQTIRCNGNNGSILGVCHHE